MKIIILTNQDIASNYAVNLLLAKLKHHSIDIFLSSAVGAQQNKPQALKHLAYLEQDLFQQLTDIATSSDDKLSGFAQMQPKPQLLNHINSPTGIAQLLTLKPDLIISIRFGKILTSDTISQLNCPIINLHSGLLPAYRGVMATFWALLNGDKYIGTTLHYISDGSIDTGNIIAQSQITTDTSKSYLWHVLQLYIKGCQLIIKAVEQLESKQPLSVTSPSSQGNYYGFPNESELTSFKEQGLTLVDEREVRQFIRQHY